MAPKMSRVIKSLTQSHVSQKLTANNNTKSYTSYNGPVRVLE